MPCGQTIKRRARECGLGMWERSSSARVVPHLNRSCIARSPNRLQHVLKVALDLPGLETDHLAAARLKPRRARRIAGGLVGGGMNVSLDLDGQPSLRARIGRHERQVVSPSRKSAMNRPIGRCLRSVSTQSVDRTSPRGPGCPAASRGSHRRGPWRGGTRAQALRGSGPEVLAS